MSRRLIIFINQIRLANLVLASAPGLSVSLRPAPYEYFCQIRISKAINCSSLASLLFVVPNEDKLNRCA